MKTISEIIEYIVPKTLELNHKYIPDEELRISYSAIFCQSDEEYKRLTAEATRLGEVVDNTSTGLLYKIQKPLKTPAGPLWLIKIRKADPTRPQRGDADFTLKNHKAFKGKHANDPDHFKIIPRDEFEMIELRDSHFDVLSYFSNPPLNEQFGIE